jgi:DNA-binding MarR family transcriptional regulator
MSQHDDRLDDELVRAVGEELLRISRRRVQAPEGVQLDLSAFRILWLLVQRGPSTHREIGEELQLEQSTVSRQVKAAAAHGLVEREEVDGTQRLRATEQGLEAYRVDRQVRAAAFRAALAELGPSRVQRLLQDLTAFNDALERASSKG